LRGIDGDGSRFPWRGRLSDEWAPARISFFQPSIQPFLQPFLSAFLHRSGGSVGMATNNNPKETASMSRQVDYYFSLQSPWAYIGHKAFRDLVAAHDLKVNHKPVVLVDLFSETGGLPLMKRHPVRQRYRMVELQRWRDKRGLKFHLQPANWPFNARLVDGLVIAAVEAGHDPDPFLRKAFPGVWEEQLNLADAAVLTRMADDCGLPGKQLVLRSASEAISAVYEQNRQDALAADVFGSPVYVLDGEVFWGQDRIELLADALKSGREPYRSQV
jgi:2-hydroxychromene-2-carboxylate isomerase